MGGGGGGGGGGAEIRVSPFFQVHICIHKKYTYIVNCLIVKLLQVEWVLHPSCFYAIFIKGDNFCDFCKLSWTKMPFQT